MRPSRTIVRRDSSLGLAANYSEDGQQVSEYRRYESPIATTSSRQMAEQRMRYLASDENTAQSSNEHMSNSNEHYSPQPDQHGGFAGLSGALNGFGALQSQSQQDSLHNEYRTLRGDAHSALTSPQVTIASAPFSGYDPLFGPPRAGSSSTAQANAQYTGDYYTGRGSNTFVPIAGPYPPSHISAPSSDGAWGQMGSGELGSSASATTFAPGSMSGQATIQFTQQSLTPNANNAVAPPSLQHSGMASNLDAMDVDATEDDAPQETPVGSKHKHDGDF